MKKITLLIISLLFVVSTIAFTACSDPHEHSFGTELQVSDTHHWLVCECGEKKDETAHVFDKEIASSEYLKAEATATTKAQYYKSCICGKASATEYFETDKAPANLQVSDISKTYDGTPVAEPTVTFDGVGAENFAYYKGEEKLTERPTDAGTYKVVVTVDETATHAGDCVEREFTIAKVVVTIPTLEKEYDGYGEFEFVFEGPADEEIDCLVDIGKTNKNVGTYTDVAITYKSVSSENYEITATTVSATITPKVLTNISVGDATYKGSTNFVFVLSAYHGLVSGETFTLQVTTASKNVGTAVEIVSISYTNNNYSIDKSAITLNIVPKVIDNLTYAFEYNGLQYQSVTFEDDDIPGIFGDDSLFLEVYFATPNVGAGLETGGEFGFEPDFNEANYTLGENYNFSIVPKALTGSIFFDIYYGDVKKVTGRPLYYYDYEITEEEYGVVNGDSVTLRALYESPNAGTANTSCGLYEENNYVMGDLNVNNTIISVKTIELPEKQYIAEYTGSSKLMVDLSEYAEYGETLEMFFMAMAGDPSMPVSAVGEYTNNVSFSKINYSDTTNYEIKLPESYSLKIAPKKITNLDLKITYNTYDTLSIYLISKDGIVEGEEVKLMPGKNFNAETFKVGDVITLKKFVEGITREENEEIVFLAGSDKNNYDLADACGTMTCVAYCDVQYDGSCNCGTSHLTETLTFTGGESVGASATIDCDSTYEGGIYKIALEGGVYEFFGSDQFFNISGIYDSNGNILATSIGTYPLPKGTYYFHVYVGSSPSSDSIWVKKTAKILDADTMANAIVPDMEPGNSDAGVRIHNLQTHNGGDTFVLFYNVGENINALGQSINFRYEDGDGGYSATSNIESIEFYDVNGIQLNVTYDEPDMVAESGVTAVGGVYIVVTMNGEGMDNLYFYAV